MAGWYDPERHHRRSIRLKGHDYAQPGAYFVTICSQHRRPMFGEVRGGIMHRNAPGDMAHDWISSLEGRFGGITIVDRIVMPNHVHFIVAIGGGIVGAGPRVRPHSDAPNPGVRWDGFAPGPRDRIGPIEQNRGIRVGGAGTDGRMNTAAGGGGNRNGHGDEKRGTHGGVPLHVVVHWYKSITTNAYIHGVRELGWPRFAGRLWQRNYYDHIIRTPTSLDRIRRYIRNNPTNWGLGPGGGNGSERNLDW
jgi:putative transposase